MNRFCRELCLFFAMLMLAAAFGCFPAPVVQEDPVVTALPTELPIEQISIDSDAETEAPAPLTPAPATDTPVPTDTPEPVETPVPTRAPIAGDVAKNFPNYDTGTDADYSYQSDELRVAVRVHTDAEIKQVYYIADIWIRNISAFRTGFGRGEFNTGTEDAEKFAVREHAVLAVNGSYNNGLVIHNGEQFKKLQPNSSFSGVGILYEDGTLKVFNLKKDKLNINTEKKKGIVQAWQFGPALVQNGEIVVTSSKYGTRHPRIMLGYYEPGHYAVVAVDGRNSKKAIGMNEREMAELMQSLGCQEAMNLDGGTSAIMTFMGECISHPSGVDRDGDGKAGRNLKDMLLFAEYNSEGVAPELDQIPAEKVRGIK